MKTTSRSDLKKKLTENRGNSSLEMKLEHFHEKKINRYVSREKWFTNKYKFLCNPRMYIMFTDTFKNVILLPFFANV